MADTLVVFDLGRVLVRICNGWRHACEVAGIDVSSFRDPDPAGARVLHEIVCDSEVGDLDFKGFCSRAGELFAVDGSLVARMSDAYILGVYPGASELLTELRGGGVETACLSNTNENHWRIMTAPPLDETIRLIGHCFPSHLCKLRKPDTAIYEHLERETGRRGNELVFFDDLADNIDAARARGWNAELVLFDGDDRKHDPIAQMRGHLARLGLLRRV